MLWPYDGKECNVGCANNGYFGFIELSRNPLHCGGNKYVTLHARKMLVNEY